MAPIPEANIDSPDAIHGALRIVRSRSWIPLAISGGLVLVTLGYLVLGRIPVTAQGKAMFLTREKVVPFQATANGQLEAWQVKVGDSVTAGRVLALIAQPEIERQLEQAREKLEILQSRHADLKRLTETFTSLELDIITRKGDLLRSRIESLEAQLDRGRELTEANHRRKMAYLDQQERDQREMRKLNQARTEKLRAKLDRTVKLRKEGLRSEDAVLQVRRSTADQVQRVADLDLQLQKLSLKKVEASEAYLEALNRLTKQDTSITALRQQLEDLETRQAQIREEARVAHYRTRFEQSDLRRSIARFEQQLTDNGQIVSEYDGRILELTAGEGKLVTRGMRLGIIDTRTEADRVEVVAYFGLEDGKKIKPDMTLRVTPAPIQRERHGSLVAKVTEVSSFPVSTEGAAKVVGITAVARDLTRGGPRIEVFARLQRGADPTQANGLVWDLTDGPEFEITPGTVAEALVNIEEKPPLTLIIPILDNWSGF